MKAHPLALNQAILLASFLLAALPSAPAQTSVWQRVAGGQPFTSPPPDSNSVWNWPSNNNWSQAEVVGDDPCPENSIAVLQPSNWTTPNYPNGPTYDVFLGGNGAPANLEIGPIGLRSLGIQSNGGLNLQWSTSIAANTFDFQGDAISLSTGAGARRRSLGGAGGGHGGVITTNFPVGPAPVKFFRLKAGTDTPQLS